MSVPRLSSDAARAVLANLGGTAGARDERSERAETIPSTERVLEGVERLRRRSRRRTNLVRVGAFGALAAGLMMAVGIRWQKEIARRPEPTDPSPGLVRSGDADVELAFRDGTRVIARRGATATLANVREHGATFELKDGALDVHVVHTNASSWDVLAGPFGIHVTGTRFVASYDQKAQALVVAMSEGSVRVTGPCVNEPLAAPAQKSFACAPSEAREPDGALAAPPSGAPRGDRGSERDLSRPARPTQELAADPSETAAALVERADAARFVRDFPRAKELYETVRTRFPESREAAKATFLLGRVAEEAGDNAGAVTWYQTSANENRGFSQEALGRSLELAARSKTSDRARALATEYLAKHPEGPHKAFAKSVLDSR